MDKIRLCLQIHWSNYVFLKIGGLLVGVPLFLENVLRIALKLAKTGLKILWNPLLKYCGSDSPKYLLFEKRYFSDLMIWYLLFFISKARRRSWVRSSVGETKDTNNNIYYFSVKHNTLRQV